MNTEIMFSSKTDMWATPQDFFDMLDSEFGFTLDACAVLDITPVCISKGQRIAQMLILPVQHPAIVQVQQLSDTQRGNGGFGSTGR